MQIDLLHILQNLLLPILIGAVVVGGLAVYLVGRKPRADRQAAGKPDAGKPAAGRPAATNPARAAAAVPAHAHAAPAQSAPAVIDPPTLPAVPAAAKAAAPARQDPALPLVADLLLVDDSAVVRAKLRRLFEPAGYRVALARDGAEALDLLRQGRYAVLVTDLEMPRLDGVGLIRATQAMPACSGMPVLAITGHEDLQSQLNQLQAVAGIYRKPWVDDDLLGHVRTLVQPSAQPELADLLD